MMSPQLSVYNSASEYIELESVHEPQSTSSQLLNSIDENPFNDDLSCDNPLGNENFESNPFNGNLFDNGPFNESLDPALDHGLMPLPPESTYPTENAMWDAIQMWAEQHNYCFQTGRSQMINNGHHKKITYECNHAGLQPVCDHIQNDS